MVETLAPEVLEALGNKRQKPPSQPQDEGLAKDFFDKATGAHPQETHMPEEISTLVQGPERLVDGQEIPKAVWEKLLGGELYELWDEILEEGDEIYVSGGLPYKMWSGAYVIQQDGQVPLNMRSDVDVYYSSSAVGERIKNSQFKKNHTTFSTKLECNGVKVDTLPTQLLEQDLRQALEDFRALTDSHVYRGAIKQLYSRLEDPSELDIITARSMFSFEAMAIQLKRENGELVATFRDPAEFTSSSVSRYLEEKLTTSLEFVPPFLVTDDILVPDSIYALYLDAAPSLSSMSVEFPLNSEVPKYMVGSLPRILKYAGESRMEIDDASAIYHKFYLIAHHVARGEDIFKLASGEDLSESIKNKVQLAFARACRSQPDIAIEYLCSGFPLGGLISDDVAEYFAGLNGVENTHAFFDIPEVEFAEDPIASAGYIRGVISGHRSPFAQGTSTARMYAKYKDYVLTKGDALSEDQKIPEGLDEAYDFFYRLYFTTLALYRHKHILVESSSKKPMLYAELVNPPGSMDEVMGLMFYCMEWDPDDSEDLEKIRTVVSGWKPKGKMDDLWVTQEGTFEIGLTTEGIVNRIREIKEIDETKGLKALQEQHDAEDLKQYYAIKPQLDEKIAKWEKENSV